MGDEEIDHRFEIRRRQRVVSLILSSLFKIGIAVRMGNPAQLRPILFMKKESKRSNEAQLLDLLKRVLPKATDDAQLADRIYLAIKTELEIRRRGRRLEKFCGGIELPNLEQKTVDDVKLQLAASFDVATSPSNPIKRKKA